MTQKMQICMLNQIDIRQKRDCENGKKWMWSQSRGSGNRSNGTLGCKRRSAIAEPTPLQKKMLFASWIEETSICQRGEEALARGTLPLIYGKRSPMNSEEAAMHHLSLSKKQNRTTLEERESKPSLSVDNTLLCARRASSIPITETADTKAPLIFFARIILSPGFVVK